MPDQAIKIHMPRDMFRRRKTYSDRTRQAPVHIQTTDLRPGIYSDLETMAGQVLEGLMNEQWNRNRHPHHRPPAATPTASRPRGLRWGRLVVGIVLSAAIRDPLSGSAFGSTPVPGSVPDRHPRPLPSDLGSEP